MLPSLTKARNTIKPDINDISVFAQLRHSERQIILISTITTAASTAPRLATISTAAATATATTAATAIATARTTTTTATTTTPQDKNYYNSSCTAANDN